MTFVLRTHQVEHIYNPIVDVIESNLQNLPTNKSYSILSLATGAGKTSAIVHENFAHAIKMGCDIVYSSPNAASLDEVYALCKKKYSDCNVVMVKSFTGDSPLNICLTQPNIILCHPTFISQNTAAFKVFEGRNLVLFSDEAHKGFMCPSSDDTLEAFGYNISKYTAEWHNCIHNIPHLAWFLISATPLRTTFSGPMFDHISEFFDRDILCSTQKAVRSINFTTCHENISNEYFAMEDKALENLTKKYNLPDAKPTRLLQALHSWHAEELFDEYDNAAIAISGMKESSMYRFASAQSVFNHVSSKNNITNVLVANKLIGEAVNIPNATTLVSYHERNSVQVWDVNHNVEQLLGRMLRWPNVEGLDNWEDVINLVETKIRQLGDKKEVREELYLWVDIVFKYDIYMAPSWANRKGVKAFFEKHTYNIDTWKDYNNRLIVEWFDKNQQRKKYGDAEKTPHAQKGSQAYKHYKDTHRRCEMPGCNCYDAYVVNGSYKEQDYWEDLEVHHINGDRNNNDNSNLMTVCGMAHNKLDKELRINNKCNQSENILPTGLELDVQKKSAQPMT